MLEEDFEYSSLFHYRISNIEVLIRAERKPIRYLLLMRQMRYYEYLVKLPDDNILRDLMLIKKYIRPASFNFKKRGGSKRCWINCIFQHCLAASGTLAQLRCDIIAVNWFSSVGTYMCGSAEEH